MTGCSKKWRATLEKTRETLPCGMTTAMTSDGQFCGILGVVLANLTTRVTVVACTRLFSNKSRDFTIVVQRRRLLLWFEP